MLGGSIKLESPALWCENWAAGFFVVVRFGLFLILENKMAAVMFDTYKFVDKLEKAGVSSEQAKAELEALSAALSEALDSQLATKSDITKLEKELKCDINRLEKELIVLKWMVGLVLGGIITLVMKAFFPIV